MFETRFARVSLFLLRISIGWLSFWAGITKILNPSWSSAGYLTHAKTFAGFFAWFASPGVLPVTDFLNKWGLTFLGISLLLGIGVRFSSMLGAGLMLLYYFPILDFPYPNEHSFLVDEHIVYAFVLLFFAAVRAGRAYGLEKWCAGLPICSRFPKLREWWG